MSELTQKIFLELLIRYHDGIGVKHAAGNQKEVAHHLAKEAYFMALEYLRTINELDNS